MAIAVIKTRYSDFRHFWSFQRPFRPRQGPKRGPRHEKRGTLQSTIVTKATETIRNVWLMKIKNCLITTTLPWISTLCNEGLDFHFLFFFRQRVFVYLYFVRVDARICVVSVFSFVFRALHVNFLGSASTNCYRQHHLHFSTKATDIFNFSICISRNVFSSLLSRYRFCVTALQT